MLVCGYCGAMCQETHAFCFSCGADLACPSQPPREDLLIGRTLPGGYRVKHLIGIGGMGRVYCADQVALGRTVAVKVVHPHLAGDELAAARFLNEARTASRMGHPNSVAIFDFGQTDDRQPYIVMEYLRGRDLARVVREDGPMPLARVVSVLGQALAALQEAHALGIVHRDLKPDNIVLEPLRSGLDFVKVVDFGLAKVLERGPPLSGGRGMVTRPGVICGTPEYMSPEQARGDALDGRSDLYSVGIILFELLTGRLPFTGGAATKTLLLQLTEPAPDPRTVAPDREIPSSFAEITLRALAKAPEERFEDAQHLADALSCALLEVDGRRPLDPINTATAHCRACGASGPSQRYCGECGAQVARATPPASTRLRSSGPPDPRGPTLRRADAVGGSFFTLPLLARDDALAWLEARRQQAAVMLAPAHVFGEAATGKTRLIHEFLARCASRGDHVVVVGPDPAWARIADTAAREAIRGLARLPGVVTDGSAWTRATADARRGLELSFGLGDSSPMEAVTRRRVMAEALRWALARAKERAGGAVVVLVVDDLDFVDGTSRNAFADILAEPPAVPALVLVAYVSTNAADGEPLPGERWRLGPLPHATFAHLLPKRLTEPERPLVPLHVEQLLAWSRETRDAPPERLADLIGRRTERLPADARHVLHALAVWGDDASPEALTSLLPSSVDMGAALDALDRARFVTIDEGGIRIAHPLVRRVVFSSIPAELKREIFERANLLRPEGPLEMRARHALHSGGSLEALSLLDALSARRASQGDLVGSVGALRHALDLTRRELHRGELDDPVGAGLVFARKLGEALASSQQWNDAEGVLREALGNAPPTSEHRARLLGVLAHVANARRQPGDARRYVDEAMRVAKQSDARQLLPMLERIKRDIAVA
ncbi:MAG: protein kinase [Myxococcota bacterium]|nr:protein kinase [Myxococcota bacterium]